MSAGLRIRRFCRRAARRAARSMSRVVVSMAVDRKAAGHTLQRLGTGYGGWWIPADMVGPESICYLAGVGTDASFDLALADRFGAKVFSFDPTPASIDYMTSLADSRVIFQPWGIWSEDRTVRFYVPPWSASLSVYDLHYSDAYFDAPCYSLGSVMKKLGHDRIDLLKLDIEGAWDQVIKSMLHAGIHPKILCVEFDSPAPPHQVFKCISNLRVAGYSIIKREKDNVTFIQRHSSPEIDQGQ